MHGTKQQYTSGLIPDRPLHKPKRLSRTIEFSNEDKFVEILSDDNKETGFNSLSKAEEISLFLEEPKFTIKELQRFLPDAKHKSITGWNSQAEYEAYDKGRADEEDVLIAFIEKWTGSTNSALGSLLNSKFKNMAAQNQLR